MLTIKPEERIAAADLVERLEKALKDYLVKPTEDFNETDFPDLQSHITDPYEQINRTYLRAWDDVMAEDSLSKPYAKVSVLLLYFDKQFDNLGIKSEVDALGSTFESFYGYEVRHAILKD